MPYVPLYGRYVGTEKQEQWSGWDRHRRITSLLYTSTGKDAV